MRHSNPFTPRPSFPWSWFVVCLLLAGCASDASDGARRIASGEGPDRIAGATVAEIEAYFTSRG
jgi:hypothetical protein